MKTFTSFLVTAATYFFILLFCYAAISKMLDFENFQVQIGQSPLLSAYAGIISYSVILIEFIIVGFLSFSRSRITGLYASTALMSAFSFYIFLVLRYSDYVPCSCGGILEKMGWTEHLIFNIGCVLIGITALVLQGVRHDQKIKLIIFYLVYSHTVSILSVLFLFLSSEHVIKKENNFTRRFLPHPLVEDQAIYLNGDHYYFAGTDKSTVYLGNRLQPSVLYNTDPAFSHLINHPIRPDRTQFTFRHLQLQVQAPYYYLYDGSIPIIYRNRLGNLNAKTISYQDAYFNQIGILDSTKFALRIRNSTTNQYSLALLDLTKDPKLEVADRVLTKQIDGIFDCDGKLISYPPKSETVYMYSYRNQFLVLDQQLRVKHALRTVDTTTVAQVKPVRLSNGTHKMEAPPFKVNHSIAVYGNKLFNHSHVMGKYEPTEYWKNHAVFDIYRTDQQEYIASFYLEKENGKTVSEILVTHDYLYALIGNRLKRYRYRTSAIQYFTGEAENLKTSRH